MEDILMAEETIVSQELPGGDRTAISSGMASEIEEAPFGRAHAFDPAKFLLPWLDAWVKPSAPTTDEVATACQELEDQAALFRDLPSDPDERAQHFAKRFRDVDIWRGPLPTGHLPLHSFAKALHDVGFDLSRREAAVIGFAFRVRSSGDGTSKGGSTRHHSDIARVANPGRAPSLYECVPGTRVFYRNIEGLEAGAATRVGALHAVRKADPESSSYVERGKVLSRSASGALPVGCGTADGLWYTGTIIGALERGLALVRFDEGQMGGGLRGGERRVRRSCLRLPDDPGNQPRVAYVPFLRWLLSILPVDGGDNGDVYDDDLNFRSEVSNEGISGKIKKKGHGNKTAGGRDRYGESSEGWWVTEEELAERLLSVMEAKGGMGFVGELRSRFRVADANQDGYLSKKELKTVLENVGMPVSAGELGCLMQALDANADGGVSYGEIVQFLLRHLGAWEQREAAVAAKVVRAMGTTPNQRRRWLAALRRRFFGLDRFQDGLLGGGQLLGALRGLGVVLSDDEGMRLLDALEVEPWKQGDDDSAGGVRYSELLRFCARHAGPGESPVMVIAQRFRDALKRQIGPFFLQDVRRLFNAFDMDGDGLISPQEFSSVCDELLGPRQKISADAKKRLLAAIDTDGFGKIAYPDFVRFVVEPSLHEPWFRNDTELAERFAGALRRQAAPGHLMEALQDAFDRADVGKSGRLDRDAVLRLLRNLQFRPSLRDHEVSRLVGLLDKDQDGLVSYKELLAFMLQHLDRRRDRLPEVLAAMRDQLRPLRKSRRGLLKRFADMCELLDADGSGRVRPDELRKAADAVGLNVPLADAQVLSETLDTLGDGRIPWATIIDECGREDTSLSNASISSSLPTTSGIRTSPEWRYLAPVREGGVVDIGKPHEDRNIAMPANALIEEVRQALADAGVRLRGELLQCMRYQDVARCGMLPEAHLFVAITDVAPELRLSKRERQALLQGVRQDQQGRFKYSDFVELLLSSSKQEPQSDGANG
jgi:Ca2+-binding EF-hand superfamily protein